MQLTTATTVYVTLQFEGFHRWKNAPADVGFLRMWHRHMFGVHFEVYVDHNDRAVEFFQMKRHLWERVQEKWEGRQFEASCEAIAADLIEHMVKTHNYAVHSCRVDEDGENGAKVLVTEQFQDDDMEFAPSKAEPTPHIPRQPEPPINPQGGGRFG